LILTFDGKNIISFRTEPAPNGFYLFFTYPDAKGLHLTCTHQSGRVEWHVSDPTYPKEQKELNRPLGRFYTNEDFTRRLNETTKNMIREYHGNQTVWTMTEFLINKIKTKKEELDPNPDSLPLELLMAEVECDFKNPERWRKIKVRDMLGHQNVLGFMEDRNNISIVQPISKALMWCYTPRQFVRFENALMDIFGIQDYLDYAFKTKGVALEPVNRPPP